MVHTKKFTPTFAAFGALAVLLAGCSSSPSEPSSNGNEPDGAQGVVYDFTQVTGSEPAAPGQEIVVVLPDDLREAAGESIDKVLAKSFTVSAHELGSAEYCATDISVNFAPGDSQDVMVKHFDDSGYKANDTDGQKIGIPLIRYGGNFEVIEDLDDDAPERGL